MYNKSVNAARASHQIYTECHGATTLRSLVHLKIKGNKHEVHGRKLSFAIKHQILEYTNTPLKQPLQSLNLRSPPEIKHCQSPTFLNFNATTPPSPSQTPFIYLCSFPPMSTSTNFIVRHSTTFLIFQLSKHLRSWAHPPIVTPSLQIAAARPN